MKLKFWGSLAQFTQPQYKAEPFSYPVMTFSAAKGLLESVFWKPEIAYEINSIQVLNKIDYLPIRRNMIKSKQNPKTSNYRVSEDRTQRNCITLRNVAYIVDFDFDVLDESQNYAKYHAILNERVKKGGCFKQPYFGCREYIAYFDLPDGNESIHMSLLGERDLGVMPKKVHFIPNKRGKITWKNKDEIVRGEVVFQMAHFKMVNGLVVCSEN